MHDATRRRVVDVLTCIRRRCRLDDAGRALAPNAERHLLPPDVFARRFADLPEAVRRTLAVADRCAFRLDELRYTYPHEVVPDGWSAMGWLRELVRRGLIERYPDGAPARVVAECDRELEIIEQLDFPSYFLTVHDVVRWARERNILCQGRGSAANSSVCYVLGVTSVSPDKASLLFERFLSVERNEPPDIDVDFEHERREEVIQYVYERYGRERAAMVNEMIAYRPRSAIRDVGKVFGMSLDQVDRLAGMFGHWSGVVERDQLEQVRAIGLDPSSPAVRWTLEVAGELMGLPRHLGIHSGGFVIADQALVDLVPVEPATMEGRTVVQWDKYGVEGLRFVKVDLLALGMLTALRRCFDLVRGAYGVDLALHALPHDDDVYEMFGRADTVGVFQIESRAQQSMLPRLKPKDFYDLVIEVSIVRPGPIQGGMVHPYLRRRNGEEEVTYLHPALERVLGRTLGVPLFQEQVMQIAVEVGGFTPGEADGLRRAMGAWRKRGGLEAYGDKLKAGMAERGLPPEFADAVFRQILGFGDYGFPESHAASFALLVYASGWLKLRYPEAFCAALINSQPMGFYSPRALVADAQRHGVEARPVDVLHSGWDCSLEPADGRCALRLGLRMVRGLPEAA
ncbi:MAG TPA: error-prone DNA polymerase, partial [Myxococcota bacterium]|nr:error-prone DNA polymerase [Myxococcota bacterium]